MAIRAKGRIFCAAVMALGIATGTAEAAKCGKSAAGFNNWLEATKKEAPRQGGSRNRR